MTGKRVLIAILAAASAGLAFGVSSASATFPGENGLISFSRSNLDGSNSQIWVKSPLTGEEQQLTFGPGQGIHPAWSADGESIVFSYITPDSQVELATMNHDGGNVTLVTDTPEEGELDAAYDPTGQRIVYKKNVLVGSLMREQIWTMNADGSGQTPLFTSLNARSPSYSPDGQHILFEASVPSFDSEIWVMGPNGEDPTRLTFNATSDQNPSWTPDGGSILFAREDAITSYWELFAMTADGQNQHPVAEAPARDYFNPVSSPDSKWIAFDRVPAVAMGSRLFLIDPNGQNETRFTDQPGTSDGRPDWQALNPPACDLTGKATQKSFKQVSVTITCANEDATAVAEGSGKAPKVPTGAVASKAKKFAIAPVTSQVQQGTPTSVTLKIPKKGRKALKKAARAGKKGKATITATLTDGLGQSSTNTFSVKFKAKKK